MQTENPFLDGLAKAFTNAAGAAQSVRAEIDTFVKQRLEKLVADMDFVPREERAHQPEHSYQTRCATRWLLA